MHNKKLLVISGPTATGKTAFAEYVSKHFPHVLISADSRQVYRGLNIGTGKDNTLEIKLIDIKNPNDSYSSHDFFTDATREIEQSHSENKLPIVVGGSGYYLKTLLSPESFSSSKSANTTVRSIISKLPLIYVQFIYRLIYKNQFAQLNFSEQNNKSRLAHKISQFFSPAKKTSSKTNYDILHLSLFAKNSYIFPRIEARIKLRLALGLIQEIKNILQTYSWSDPGLNTIAYKEFKPFFKGTSTLKKCIEKWTQHEHAYVRRQKTFFRQFPQKVIVDISKQDWQKNALLAVTKWYNTL